MKDKEFCQHILEKITTPFQKFHLEEAKINMDVISLTLTRNGSKEFYILALEDKAYSSLIKFLLDEFANKKIVLL